MGNMIFSRALRRSVDRRLSSLQPSADRRARIRQAIMQQEEPIMKRKLSLSMALALALAVLLAGLAAAAGLDLFRFFAQEEDYLPDMLSGAAPLSTPANAPAVAIETDGNIRASAVICNAYYDGQFLVLAHSLSGSYGFALTEPTDQQLAAAEETSYARYPRYAADPAAHQQAVANAHAQWDSLSRTVTMESRAAMDAFSSAVQRGEAACLAYSTVHVAPRISLNGSSLYSLGVGSFHTSQQDDSTWYTVETYPYPLPAAAQDQESLDVALSLDLLTHYLYFDGSQFYNLPQDAQRDIARMQATAIRADVSTSVYAGSGAYQGAQIEAEAFLNDALGAVTLRAGSPVFTMADLSGKWNLLVLDPNGNELEPASLFPVSVNPYADKTKTLTYTIAAGGSAPEALYVYPYYGSGEQTDDEIKAACEPIVLYLAD